ncbi:hypothetical protein C8J26_2579 [Sphingomonas aurantiaca]|jgi:hypothetical protein|uniref:Uncharacterized protein n=1 Tax=Sphingomonas aurantiaca TaxID=185949 RepID=A0A2T5GK74_9SPHN|nr:hypothetical protein [Sphingomonas aurantiaca]PTQ59727.1 hypothetical protein C8J26_2579 [Sphingomonas aurantiaca]
MMTDRDVWMKAGAILAEHGAMTADYIIDQISDAIGDRVAVEDWRRVAAAVDAISDAQSRGAN